MHILKKSVLAIALAFPAIAMAESVQDLKAELNAMKVKIKQLESLVEAISTKADAASKKAEAASVKTDEVSAKADAVSMKTDTVIAEHAETKEDFNHTKIKSEALQDQFEAGGLKGLKISGFVDPTYIYNQRQGTSSFIFLKNFNDVNGNGAHPSQKAFYSYDNAYFGSALVRFEKELESGTKFFLELQPAKSYGDSGGFNLGSIVNQAYVSVPLDGANDRLLVGQYGSWSGYEYQLASGPQSKKTITNNLLFDFTEPVFITGAGYEKINGQWDAKFLLGNLNNGRVTDRKAPVLHWRVDYAKGEFEGWGASGLHGKTSSTTSINYVDLDTYFIRGDWTWQGQIETGYAKRSAYNGGNSKWIGASSLLAYKFAPRVEGIARIDYVRNNSNGGGLPGIAFVSGCSAVDLATDPTGATGVDASCGDYRNGFGPGVDNATGLITNPNKGANRYAVTLGLNYILAPNTTLKFEVRRDGSSQNTFYDVNSQTYKKDNLLLGTSAVVSF
jgi:hypothetical protein